MTLQEINKAYNRIVGSLDSKELKMPSIPYRLLLQEVANILFRTS